MEIVKCTNSILILPNEILLIIFSKILFSQRTLRNFSLLCKKCKFLVQRILLEEKANPKTLIRYSEFTNLKTLRILCDNTLNGETIQHLNNMEILEIKGGQYIKDDHVEALYKLRVLNLRKNTIITDSGISSLTKLQCLSLNGNDFITNKCLMNKKYLKILFLKSCFINDLGLQYIPQIEQLKIPGKCLTDFGMQFLTNIQILILSGECKITDEGLQYIKNIKNFNVRANISDKGLTYLPKLSKVGIYSYDITPKGFINQSHIIYLCLPGNNFTDSDLIYFCNLRYLYMPNNFNIGNEGLQYLFNIKHIELYGNTEITDEYFINVPETIESLIMKKAKITTKGWAHLCEIKNMKTCIINDENINIYKDHTKNINESKCAVM